MRYHLLFVLFLTSQLSSKCQGNLQRGTFVGFPKGIQVNELVSPDWQARTIEAGALWGTYNGIKGTAFYNEGWSKGYILLSNNEIARDVSIRFNIYTNEIYFLSGSHVLVLDESIPPIEFEIQETNKTTVFRCGYPAISNNTGKTFYKILADGKIALLKLYNKRIMEAINSVGAFERKFTDSESWYIYNTFTNKMIQIKKNKNSILEALPEYTNKIESIKQEKGLKLKNEEEWIILINELKINQDKYKL